jgi:hypothetical protein
MKWEYRLEKISPEYDGETQEFLNMWGEQGWELVQIVEHLGHGGPKVHTAYLRRLKD